ncbi:DUF3887 domain-containing protein [Clostridium bowmanii]|uniref:DUF3887 domain-containing protein n=1 Tax=Clostridium bowmanii TaxID=132925 RepID=UPI001C0C72D3|nr:DUF3887 domain-containing protein [Clostridium bowmanii]MBU3188964.1 DUF3887 domain-containing protein [Clostridium bowmanii]MCA1073625.1 DUF3887 domain-containing protein [Clostridium bowmanii]
MKDSFKKLFVILCSVLVMASILTGCNKKLAEKDVEYAAPLTENILQAVGKGDYAQFSKDFSDELKKGIPEESFKTLCTSFSDKIGKYESKKFTAAAETKKDGKIFKTVIYTAKYSKEKKDVQVTASFTENDGKILVEGIFFKSPNLVK